MSSSAYPQVMLLLFMLVLGPWAKGQDFDHYKQLEFSGNLPEDFWLSHKKKYRRALENIDAEEQKARKRAKASFYEQSTWYVNQLLLSGEVFFNDPVSKYLQEIGAYLLRDHEELKEKIRFYAVRSSDINAFATSDGIVLVNMGLISHLDNEAQLALTLCHEISHYRLNHSMDIFLEYQDLERERQALFQRNRLGEVLGKKSRYSQKKELEADSLALDLFLNSHYNIEEGLSLFNVLEKRNTSFADSSFHPVFFEDQYLKFPMDYHLGDMQFPYAEGNRLSLTHPDAMARKGRLAELLGPYEDRGAKKWHMDAERFYLIRKICRFELCYELLIHQSYEEALYQAYLLLSQNPESIYLKKTIAYSLYALSRYANYGKEWNVMISHEEVGGKAKALFYFFEKISPTELNLLAIKETWKCLQLSPGDTELRAMLDDLMLNLGRFHFEYIPKLSVKKGELFAPIEEASIPIFMYTLKGLLRNSLFTELLKQRLRDVQNQQSSGFLPTSASEALENLDINKVVWVDPFYQLVDIRREGAISYSESELSQRYLLQLLSSQSQQIGIKGELLSMHKLTRKTGDKFHDLMLLHAWISEQMQHGELSLVSINHAEVQKLAEKYDTEYFIWPGILATRQKRRNKGMIMMTGLLVLPLPYALYYVSSPQHVTSLYVHVFDLSDGKRVAMHKQEVKMKDRDDVVNSILYDFLIRLGKDEMRL